MLFASKRHGVTLIEVVAGACVFAIFIALLLGASSRIRHHHALKQAMKNGRGIYISLFTCPEDNFPWGSPVHEFIYQTPKANPRFDNSTEFFRNMVTNDWIDTDFSIFSLRHQVTLHTTNAYEFTEDHNGWNLTTDTYKLSPFQPYITTRNLQIDQLDQNISTNQLAFWKEVVVIQTGGSGEILTPEVRHTMTNGFGATNSVLRP